MGHGIYVSDTITATGNSGIYVGGNVSASKTFGIQNVINGIHINGNVTASDVGIYVGRSINTTVGSGVVVG